MKSIAQDVMPPTDFQVYMEVAPTDTTNLFGDSLFSPNTQLTGTVVLVLQDTSNIKNINVSIGAASGGSNLFQKTFVFDNAGSFSDGTSYKRQGLVVYLGVGAYTGLNSYSAQVTLQDNSGYSTPVVSFSNN